MPVAMTMPARLANAGMVIVPKMRLKDLFLCKR